MPDFDNVDLAIIAIAIICIYAMYKGGMENIIENCILVIASLATGKAINKRK